MWISQFLLSVDEKGQWEKMESFMFLELYKKFKSINEKSNIASLDILNKKYILVLRKKKKTYIIAVSDNNKVIFEHYEYLKYTVIPEMLSLKNMNDDKLLRIVEDKIAFFASGEEGDVDSKSIDTFHRLFDNVIKGEKLISSFEGSWKNRKKVQNVTLYLSEDHLCISSNERYIFHFKEIVSLKKETIKLVLKAVRIKFMRYGREKTYFFITNKRDEAYDIIENIWLSHLNIWRLKLENPNTEEEFQALSRINLDVTQFSRNIKNKFRIQDDPIDIFECSLIRNDVTYLGELILTRNCFCFEAHGLNLMFIMNFRRITLCSITSDGKMIEIVMENGNKFNFICKKDIVTIVEKRQKDLRLEEPDTLNLSYECLFPSENIENEEQLLLIDRWERYFKEFGFGSSMIINDEYKELISCGIPEKYRRFIWLHNSGAIHHIESDFGVYEEFLTEMLNSPVPATISQIDKDVKRSMPTHPFYKEEANLIRLRNVLMAYAAKNPSIGYCQGMNMVASILLLHLTEAEAFWVLSIMIENISSNYYNKHLFGTLVDQRAFWKLLAKKEPTVADKLDLLELPLDALVVSWFMCYFVDRVSFDLTLRIIDLTLFFGSPILFQFALSIFISLKECILKETQLEYIPMIIKSKDLDEKKILEIFERETLNSEELRYYRTKCMSEMLRKLQKKSGKSMVEKALKGFPEWKKENVEEILEMYVDIGKGNFISNDQFKHIVLYFFPNLKRIVSPLSQEEDQSVEKMEALVDSLLFYLPVEENEHKSHINMDVLVKGALPTMNSTTISLSKEKSKKFMYSPYEDSSDDWVIRNNKSLIDKTYSLYQETNNCFDFQSLMEIFTILKSSNVTVLLDFCEKVVLSGDTNCSIQQVVEITVACFDLLSTGIEEDDDKKLELRAFAISLFGCEIDEVDKKIAFVTLKDHIFNKLCSVLNKTK